MVTDLQGPQNLIQEQVRDDEKHETAGHTQHGGEYSLTQLGQAVSAKV